MKWWHFVGLAILLGGVMSTRRLSDYGLDHIKRQEGLRLSAYRDQAGYWTIGYGHKITPEDNMNFATEITEEKAEQLLRQDLAKAKKEVEQRVKVNLSQSQFDALVSFVFNVGVPAFRESTLLRKLNAGDYEGAADELLRWNKITVDGSKVVSQILANRRETEKRLFTG